MSATPGSPPAAQRAALRHYEDFEVGQSGSFGDYPVSKEEIISFALAYDPQAHHIDEEAAKSSITKGLCASGFHSCAMMMRILCDGLLLDTASLGSPGIDEVKWRKPIRPGDKLSINYAVTGQRKLKSKPGVGLVRFDFDVVTQNGEVAMQWLGTSQFIRCRDGETQ